MEYKGRNIDDYTTEDFNNLNYDEQIEFCWLQMERALQEWREQEAAAAAAAATAEVRSTADWPDAPLDVSTD